MNEGSGGCSEGPDWRGRRREWSMFCFVCLVGFLSSRHVRIGGSERLMNMVLGIELI